MRTKIGLQKAGQLAAKHLDKKCRRHTVSYWVVSSITEDVPNGVYVIRCAIKCFLKRPKKDPRHFEVWINADTGRVEHQVGLPDRVPPPAS